MSDGLSPEAPSLVCGSAALVFGPHVWTCHRLVFGDDFADYDTWYLDLFEKHAKSPGHRLVLTQEDDIITGYAWGYTGQRGQYWSDLLCDSLSEPIASQWVGGHFDVVELAVLPTHQRRGLGQALHDCLLEGVTGRCLLGTSSDPDGPAVRLYTRSGWRTLGTLRTGMQVMGLDRARTQPVRGPRCTGSSRPHPPRTPASLRRVVRFSEGAVSRALMP